MTDIDWPALVTSPDDPALAAEVVLYLVTCVPDLFFSTVIDTAGVDLDKAGSGLMLNASELSTAVKYGINTTTVVFRNHSYGNVVLDLNEAFAGTYETSLHNPDFIKFAESFGAVGMRADHPMDLEPLIPQALERQAPVVIDVPLGDTPIPRTPQIPSATALPWGMPQEGGIES